MCWLEMSQAEGPRLSAALVTRLQLVWPVPVAARVIDGHHAGGWTSTPIVSGGQEAVLGWSVRMYHQLGVSVTAVMWCLNALGAWTSRLPGRPNSPPYRTSREELTPGGRIDPCPLSRMDAG